MNGSFGVFAPQDDKGNTMDLNNNSQEVHLSHYWNVIYKRWKIAVAILAVVGLLLPYRRFFAKGEPRKSTTA